jgi:hypothetical protein
MYKTQLFTHWYNGTEEINEWLEQNPNIEIISTNIVANRYIILYQEKEEVHE